MARPPVNRTAFPSLGTALAISTAGAIALLMLSTGAPSSPAVVGWHPLVPSFPPAAGTPSAPQLVTAIPHNQAINLTWQPPAVPGAGPVLNYTVERWNASEPTPLLTKVGGSTLHTWVGNLTNGTSYWFAVAASNVLGIGNYSANVTGIPGDAPGRVPSLDVVPGNGSAEVEWEAPFTEDSYPILSYELRLSQGGTNLSFNSSADSESYLLDGLVNGVSYLVSVRGVNALGPGPYSPSAFLVPAAPPSAPLHLSLTWVASAGRFVASWAEPAYLGGAPVTNFTLTWTVSGGAPTSVRLGPQVFSYPLPALPAGGQLEVQLHASNRGGVGPDVSTATWVPQPSGPSPIFIFLSTPAGFLLLFLSVATATGAVAWRLGSDRRTPGGPRS